MPSVKRLINRSRSAQDLTALTQLIAKAKELNDGTVQASLARRANQLGSHDLALSLVEKFTGSEPQALREAIAAALALDDVELFDDFEFALETMLRRSGNFSAEITDLRLSDKKKKSDAGPIPDRWLPKAARSGGAQGSLAATGKPISGGAPSSAQVEVSKSRGRRARK